MEIKEGEDFSTIDYQDLQTLLSDDTLVLSKTPDGGFVQLIVKFEDYDPDKAREQLQQQATAAQELANKKPTSDVVNARFASQAVS